MGAMQQGQKRNQPPLQAGGARLLRNGPPAGGGGDALHDTPPILDALHAPRRHRKVTRRSSYNRIALTGHGAIWSESEMPKDGMCPEFHM